MDSETPETGTITIDVDGDTIDMSTFSNMTYTMPTQAYSNYVISTTGGYNGTSWGSSNITASTMTFTNENKLHVKGDTVIEGDLKVDGVSFKETIESINKRLAILRPDPEKLEHFEALRKAYEHYKTLEALCELPKKEDK